MTDMAEQLDIELGSNAGSTRSYWNKEEEVEPGTTLSELFERPDLNFTVEKLPIQVVREGPPRIVVNYDTDEFVATCRINGDGEFDGVLGCVTPRYSVVQNLEAFGVCEYVAGLSGAEYVSAGAHKNGRRVWATMKLPEEERKLRIAGDLVHRYMMFVANHDGGGAVTLAHIPVRNACTNAIPVVCWTVALGSSSQVARIRHTGDTDSKLHTAEKALEQHRNYMVEFAKLADQLALKKATPRQLNRWLETMYPINRENLGDRAITNRERAREAVKELVLGASNLDGHHQTGWAFVNAVAEYTDWGSRRRRDQMAPLLGTRETSDKNRALHIVLDSLN